MRWYMNIPASSSSAIHRPSAGTRAFLQSARARAALSCTSIVARNCLILRSCCGEPPNRRAGGRVHTRSAGGRASNRRGHRSQSRAVCKRRSRAGGHSFGEETGSILESRHFVVGRGDATQLPDQPLHEATARLARALRNRVWERGTWGGSASSGDAS
jgi:hypothetical protein